MNKSKSRDISHMIKQLKDNIRERTSVVNPELLITVMDEQLFPYYHGAFSYYRNAVKTIDSLKPDLVIINAEIETHFLVAQAAKKNKITTALLPHGIDCLGFKEVKHGKFKFIDKCFAFGNEDVLFNKIHLFGDIIEAVSGRMEFTGNKELLELITRLYWDETGKKPKVGAATDVRRLCKYFKP